MHPHLRVINTEQILWTKKLVMTNKQFKQAVCTFHTVD